LFNHEPLRGTRICSLQLVVSDAVARTASWQQNQKPCQRRSIFSDWGFAVVMPRRSMWLMLQQDADALMCFTVFHYAIRASWSLRMWV
jgi:GDP-D-mannose dehydratase